MYLLTALLTYHVTEEVLYSGGLKDGQEVPTVEKSKLVISINGNHTQIIQTLSSLLENGSVYNDKKIFLCVTIFSNYSVLFQGRSMAFDAFFR